MEMTEISGAAIAKRLASCKLSSRNGAVRLLCSWLPKQSYDPSTVGVLDAELIKIWKGLFFCVWHSDKLPSQLELISRLSSLLLSLPPPLAGRYVQSFLITIRREWSGIDFLRLDKFYLLIRMFLRHVFLFLKNNSWGLDLTDQIVGILLQGSLLSSDKFPAAGVNYHIAEIFLDEISVFLPLAKEILDLMLNPFISVMQITTDKVLVNKIRVNIFDRLAVNGSNLLTNAEPCGEVEKFGKIALAMGFSKRFFDMASANETLQGNRKVLFDLHDMYVKLDKKLEKLGLDISLEKLDTVNLARENAGDMEATMVFCTGSCDDINEESDKGLIQKKKKMKKAGRELDETGINFKSNKKEKRSPGSFTENTATESEKLKKSKKRMKKADSSPNSNGAEETIRDLRAIANHDDGKCNSDSNEMIGFDDTLLSNLQKQFEKVASEAGMVSMRSAKVSKKRKHTNRTAIQQDPINSENFVRVCDAGKSEDMNAKKVRFSMNNNLIWKPQNPLPPQNLRLPPSVAPRGSALKKGLSPGPIRKSPPTVKKINVKGSSGKIRKKLKIGSPAAKHFQLLQCLSS